MDAEYEIDSIIGTEENAFNGLSKTWFTSGGGQMYLFHKPENLPVVGQVLTGTVSADKRGSLKFTKKKIEPFPSNRPQPVQTAISSVTKPQERAVESKTYKADPDKMKQEFTLEQARNMSIQRQVGLKATVDLILGGIRTYDQLIGTYCDMMEILSEPNWRELEELKDIEADMPPIESYDVVPEDLMDEEALDKAFKHMEEQEPETQ